MGTYGLQGVIDLWKADKLTTERAIGQILLLLQDIEERLSTLEGRADAQQTRQAPGQTGETLVVKAPA